MRWFDLQANLEILGEYRHKYHKQQGEVGLLRMIVYILIHQLSICIVQMEYLMFSLRIEETE